MNNSPPCILNLYSTSKAFMSHTCSLLQFLPLLFFRVLFKSWHVYISILYTFNDKNIRLIFFFNLFFTLIVNNYFLFFHHFTPLYFCFSFLGKGINLPFVLFPMVPFCHLPFSHLNVSFLSFFLFISHQNQPLCLFTSFSSSIITNLQQKMMSF